MKNKHFFVLPLLLAILLIPLLAIPANAATSGDFEYEIDDGIEGGQIWITGYSGKGGKVSIPSKIEGCPVTEIQDEAFLNCTGITEVVIPKSVSRIGYQTFSGCTNLRSVTIPASIEEIGNRAFFNCTSLQSVTIPDQVTEIPDRAFWGCQSLKSVTLGAGVETIGEAAFVGCSAMTTLTLGNRITAIADQAFFGCESLSSVKLPKNLKSIGSSAFSGCEALTSIAIPSGVTQLGSGAFSGCHGLTSFVIPNGITAISDNLLDACWNLKSVTIPESVTSIGKFAFCETKLTSIQIPDSVTSIGRGAFSWCESLKTVTFPKGITTLPDDLFHRASSLQSVHIPGSITNIGTMAFYECTALKDVYYNGSKTSAGKITVGADNQYLKKAAWHYTAAITQQPQSVAVAEGMIAKVTVKATGDGLRYKWYYKDAGASGYTYTATFNGNSYSVIMNEARNGRRVLCKVTDKYGNTVQSASALLSMKKPATPLTITQQPQSVTVAEGQTAKITVKATGDGLTYRWYYKNSGATGYTYTPTFKGNTYSIIMNEARNGRRVLCKIYDKYGNMIQSGSALLNMATELKITEEPRDVTVAWDETAKVTVQATGDGLTYQWYYKDAGTNTFRYTSSFTGNTYSVTMNPGRDGRRIYCKITDRYGISVTSRTVSLNMKQGDPVQIVTQPQNVTVAEGEMAKVTVTATGEGLSYRWYYKNAGADSYIHTSSFTGNTYSVKMDAERNGRRVLCKIYDRYGNMVQSNSVLLKME